jgi:hypothetical protein
VIESVEGFIIWTTERGDQRNKRKYLSCVLKAHRFTGFPLFSPIPIEETIHDQQFRDWLLFDISTMPLCLLKLSSAVPELSHRYVQEGIIESLFLYI